MRYGSLFLLTSRNNMSDGPQEQDAQILNAHLQVGYQLADEGRDTTSEREHAQENP